MGGCRCSFRDCKVSSYNVVGMHFFHFPMKDWIRYRKWRQYAKKEEMLNYTKIKQKNMVVCARHFRPECFMNYKLERLTPSAVPTITRLSETKALDYELDLESGVLIKLEKPKFEHLIAPPDYECILNLVSDEKYEKQMMEMNCEVVNVTDGAKKKPVGKQNPNQFTYNLSSWENDEFTIETTPKTASNMVQILETIQLSAASHLKRPRDDFTTTTEDTTNLSKKPLLPANDDGVLYANAPSTSQQSEIEVVESLIYKEDFQDDQDNESGDSVLEFVEIRKVSETQDNFEENDIKTSIVEDRDNHTLMETMKTSLLEAQTEINSLIQRLNDAKVFEVKVSNLEKENFELKEKLKQNETLKTKLILSEQENTHLKNSINDLEKIKENPTTQESDILKAKLLSHEQSLKELENLVTTIKAKNVKHINEIKKQFELELVQQHDKYLKNTTTLEKHISTLEESLELSKQQTPTTRNQLSEVKSNVNDMQLEKLNLSKQNMEIEQSLQLLQSNYDTLDQEHKSLQVKYNCLQQKHTNLEEKYLKLETLQNQVATVTTTLDKTPKATPPVNASSTLTKAQLFNSVKRYISSSMASLLRMEMFGSSEREWKPDERQVAVDLLRLGEAVYKFITDEWRFRLPAVRDVRTWLSQSVEIDDEEDL